MSAVISAKKALEIRGAEVGEYHPGYFTNLNELAELFILSKDYRSALQQYKTARKIGEDVLGIEHPHFGICLERLAECYRLMGDNEKSLELFKNATNIYKQALGEKYSPHSETLDQLIGCATKLADLYKLERDYDKSLAILKEAAGFCKNITPSFDNENWRFVDYARCYYRRGEIYLLKDDSDRAIREFLICKEVLEEAIESNTDDFDHQLYDQCLENLASLYG